MFVVVSVAPAVLGSLSAPASRAPVFTMYWEKLRLSVFEETEFSICPLEASV